MVFFIVIGKITDQFWFIIKHIRNVQKRHDWPKGRKLPKNLDHPLYDVNYNQDYKLSEHSCERLVSLRLGGPTPCHTPGEVARMPSALRRASCTSKLVKGFFYSGTSKVGDRKLGKIYDFSLMVGRR